MKCVLLFVSCALLCGCGAMFYSSGDERMSIIKLGVDTSIESAKYIRTSPMTSTTIETAGYKDEAKLELLRQVVELAK